MPKKCDPAVRVWDFIEFEPMSGCWLWTGCLCGGYARFGNSSVKTTLVHRFLYETLIGKVDDGLELDHICRLKCCVNPRHVEPVTHSENVRRGLAMETIHKAKIASMEAYRNKTHCKRGHGFTGETDSNGARICRPCRRALDSKRRLARRASVISNPPSLPIALHGCAQPRDGVPR